MKKYIIYFVLLIIMISCQHKNKNSNTDRFSDFRIPESILEMERLNSRKCEKHIAKLYYNSELPRLLEVKYSDENYILAKYPIYASKIRLLFDKKNRFWFVFSGQNIPGVYNVFRSIYLLDENFIPIFYCSPPPNPWVVLYRLNEKTQLIEFMNVKMIDPLSINGESYSLKEIYNLYSKIKKREYVEEGEWIWMCKLNEEPIWTTGG